MPLTLAPEAPEADGNSVRRALVVQTRQQRGHVQRTARRAPVDVDDHDAVGLQLAREELEPDVDHAKRPSQQAAETHRAPADIVAASSGRSARAAARAA